ncbi:acyltransferase family protein [Nitrospira sp. Nam80]
MSAQTIQSDVDCRSQDRLAAVALIEHIPAIDGLRGVAILLVAWYHAPFLFRDNNGFPQEISQSIVQKVFWGMSTAGWIGVDLFFVISGFLITSILIRGRATKGSLRVFWYRRALRILPLAVLYLSVLKLNVTLGDPLGMLSSFDAWPAYLFYMGNFHIAINGWQPVVVMILWSLAVEEQFYMVWPFLVHHVGSKKLILTCLIILALSPIARAIVYWTLDYPAVYVLTVCRLDGLAVGTVLALLVRAERWRIQTLASCRKFVPLALLSAFTVLLGPFSPSFPQTRPLLFTLFGYTWIAISFGLLVGASLQCTGWVQSLLGGRVLMFVGKRCYGFYLWHALVAAMVKKVVDSLQLDVGLYGLLCLWVIGLIVVTTASWCFFEKPILSLKRLVPSTAVSKPCAVVLVR